MKILVTGGAGFIGGHLAQRFLERAHDFVVLDNLDAFYDVGIKEHTIELARDLAEEGDGSYEFVEGSVTDSDLIADLIADVDFIFHQAAQAGVRASVDDPWKAHNVNVNGTMTMIDAALRLLAMGFGLTDSR